MDKENFPNPSKKKEDPLRAFLTHLCVFAVAFVIVLFVPVFYDGKIDFCFEDRGPMLYGFIGWGVGLAIHGLVVFVSTRLNRPKA